MEGWVGCGVAMPFPELIGEGTVLVAVMVAGVLGVVEVVTVGSPVTSTQ
jgi:hypothetical protein